LYFQAFFRLGGDTFRGVPRKKRAILGAFLGQVPSAEFDGFHFIFDNNFNFFGGGSKSWLYIPKLDFSCSLNSFEHCFMSAKVKASKFLPQISGAFETNFAKIDLIS